MRFAKTQLSRPLSSLIGVRKLLKADVEALRKSLSIEDQLIHTRINHPDFPGQLAEFLKAHAKPAS